MTNKRILQLAVAAAYDNWYRAYEITELYPNDEIEQERYKKAWKELRELEKLLLSEENKADA